MSFLIPLLATSFLLTGPAPTLGATYSLIESHAGSSFFDGWIYETGYDNTTNGDTTWSSSPSLAYVNSDNQAIIKVDNTSTVPYNEKRDSVKLLSQNWYKAGTVFIMDAVHVPVGCSVWPAWWTRGPNWPAGGEIDIFEPVNLQTTNQFALHTTEGCTATPDASLNPTGTVGTTNCDQDANYGSGCTVIGGDAGTVFNQNGGGVYIMAFETTGITIWYHRRSDIPTFLSSTASSIDTSALGTPVASYSSSSCDISKFFASQQMTLDITMCGDYAGTASVLEATCGALVGDQTCYSEYRYSFVTRSIRGLTSMFTCWNSYLRTQLDRLQRCLRETDSHPPISYESTDSKPLLPNYSSRSTISTFTAATTRSTRSSAVPARRPPPPPLQLRVRQAREWVQRLRQLG
ncbi:hypothetical protein FFLO_06228 [Filobasidium floriforme]|uniref:GH16 domain-containing protein n=1 Tax=Filobasidium floriforme TaxID=5210 RepID=A0A8K0JFD0_9TREE|nr:concanavalin A-like lectin/glucanase domain-containing protein [Filobasidium floriforme]KAG7528351.1 hypothetical protein FFLO_06228 [Filobasidium floriforme]KAH8085332.1 concanavalin A-like lectin/glucanase domain-containing protein [Filobasidium floriforme]